MTKRTSLSNVTATPSTSYDSELEDHEDDYGPPSPKRSKASGRATPSAKVLLEREKRKDARMIRNRQAAQASRDRKKETVAHLETRVMELEALLATSASGHVSFIDPASTSTPAALSSSLVSFVPSHRSLLQEKEAENTLLRTQLALEQLTTQTLKQRLGTLEDKFSKWDRIFSVGNSAIGSLMEISSEPAPTPILLSEANNYTSTIDSLQPFEFPIPHLTPSQSLSTTSQLQLLAPDSSLQLELKKDDLIPRLDANEVSLQRNIRNPLATSTTSSIPCTLPPLPLSTRPTTLSSLLASIKLPLPSTTNSPIVRSQRFGTLGQPMWLSRRRQNRRTGRAGSGMRGERESIRFRMIVRKR